MKSIHVYDPTVPVLANALGQAGVDANKFPTCANAYRGMNYGAGGAVPTRKQQSQQPPYETAGHQTVLEQARQRCLAGDGTITNREVIAATGISDASVLFEDVPSLSMGKLALSPHVYPATVTGWGEDTQRRDELFRRLDLSFGLKALGQDMTSDVRTHACLAAPASRSCVRSAAVRASTTHAHSDPLRALLPVLLQMKPLRRIAVVLAEFGVFGFAPANGRASGASDISSGDLGFLRNLSDYLKRIHDKGATISWFW